MENKTLKQIKFEVIQKILETLHFKGIKMRFPYYSPSGTLRFADVSLQIKWNQK